MAETLTSISFYDKYAGKNTDYRKTLPLVEKYQSLVRQKEKKEIMEKIITHNLGLVCYRVRKVMGRYNINGQLSLFDDAVQEGILGVIKAVGRFDSSLGYAFSTYAVIWIDRYIDRLIHKMSETVYFPEWSWDFSNLLNGKYDKNVFAKSIVQHKKNDKPEHRYLSLEGLLENFIHEDVTVKQRRLESRISDTSQDIAFQYYYTEGTELASVLAKICNNKELTILYKIYVIGKTYDEVGERFKVSRQYIHQVKIKAEDKLHHKGLSDGDITSGLIYISDNNMI